MAKKTSPTTSKPERRNPRLLIFMLIGLCILFAISYASRLIENARVQAEVAAMDDSIAESEQKQAELSAQREFVESDAYVEQVARDELGLAKPGDSVVIVLPNTDAAEADSTQQIAENEANALLATTNTAASAAAPITELPNWRQWVQLFTQERSAAIQ